MASSSELMHDLPQQLFNVTLDELIRVLRQTVAESMQAETDKLILVMESRFGIPDSKTRALAQDNQSRSPELKRTLSERSDDKSGPLDVQRLCDVSEVLFHEVLSSRPMAAFTRQVSDSKSQPGKETPARSSSAPLSESPDQDSKIKGHDSDQSRVRGAPTKKSPSECSRSHGQASIPSHDPEPSVSLIVHSPVPGTSRRVMPCPPQDVHDDSFDFQPRRKLQQSARAVSIGMQDSIISTSLALVAATASEVQHADMPFFACILRRSFPCRMSILLLFLVGTALRIALWIKDLTPMHPVRDLVALFLAIAGGCSSKQLAEAKLLMTQVANWAEVNGIGDAWLAATRKKQCWLLVWWMLSLLVVVPGETAVICRLMEAGNVDKFWMGCALAGEMATCLVFVLASTLLLSAAFVVCRIISALDVFVDAWSCALCEHRDFTEGIVSWNVIQALIRQAGVSLGGVFTTIQSFALLGCVAVAVRGTSFAL
eukprot:TRINITY_DN10873_c0_g3_i1.p1 TRINITY_DN10873_c0_g3~~TRINITY_DN10873_c0_g3_i1.p1  ORF type:complete len:485 (+),score=90.57 TRINITY_DN10873_c0_g3_i1:3-1457(+)